MGESTQRTGPMTPAERRDLALGRRGFEREDTKAAIPHLTRLLRTRNFADAHYMMGILHERVNDLDAAGRSLRDALRINPSYTEAILALANVYERQGDFERSREIAERSRGLARPTRGVIDATTRGKLANLQARLGDAYREVSELREAIAAYRKALDRCPNFHDIRYRLGITLRDAGLPDQAISEFRRIIRSHPNYLEAAIELGVTLYSLGRTDDAAEQWKAVLTEDPTRQEATRYLRMIGHY